jgi:uncharacterized protein
LLYTQSGNLVTKRSVGDEQYGRFLVNIFEEWVPHDMGRVYVQLFDVTLEAYFGRHLLCIHAPTCGYGPALKHNGDLYPCDHFVEPRYRLGNIHETHLLKLVSSHEQRNHGNNTPQSPFRRLSPATNKPQDGSAMSVPAKSPLQTGSGLAQGATM